MRRLAWVALGVVAVAVALGAHLRRGENTPPAASPPVVHPRFDVQAELTGSGMSPHRIQVPKDHEIHLVVRGAPDAPEGLLTVLGYGDRVRPVDLGPGISRELVFDSVLPGDDFGFALGKDVVGRFEVVGSHLEEGHR